MCKILTYFKEKTYFLLIFDIHIVVRFQILIQRHDMDPFGSGSGFNTLIQRRTLCDVEIPLPVHAVLEPFRCTVWKMGHFIVVYCTVPLYPYNGKTALK